MLEKILEVYNSSERKNYTIDELVKILDSSDIYIKKAIKDLEKQNLLFKNGKERYKLNTYFPNEIEKNSIKNKIISLIKDKKFVTFRNIVLTLHFRKKEEIIFLRNYLKELEKDNVIYHSKGRGFYSLEKINYFSKKYLEEHILRILNKYPDISYKKLKGRLHFTKEDNEYQLIALLQELECMGKIFINNGRYQKMPLNYKVATIVDGWRGSRFLAKIDNEDKLIKIPYENANGVLKGDVVIVSINDEENKVEKIIKRQNAKIVCEVIQQDDLKILKPYRMVSGLKPRISQNDMKNLVVGDLVLVNVSNEEIDGYYDAILDHQVGNVNDPDIDLKCIALNFGFDEEFSEEAKIEASNIPTEVLGSDIEGRVDLRDKLIFTIDDITCKDMDDAISLEKLENGFYKLGVHIADVSHYVSPGSVLYEEARNRGTSLYMINTSIPMLPRILTNGILSLNPGVDRLTMTCEMILSPDGKVVDYKIYDSVIKSKKKMNYKEVNNVIYGNSSKDYKQYEKILLEMQKLSLILNKRKEERGYLEFASVESKFKEDENGRIVAINKRTQLDAEKIIENFMVLANETVDSHLFWLGLPKMARTHGEPDEERLASTIEILKNAGYRVKVNKDAPLSEQIPDILSKFRDYEEFPIISNLILRSMARASYTTDHIGHFGLKLKRYMHFTSPIRRFPDLETHMLIKKYHSKEVENLNLEALEQELKVDAEYSSNRERMADQAENEAIALKNAEFYEGKIGEEVVGYITNFTYKKILVQTKDLVNGTISIDDIETSNLGKHGNRSLDYRIKMDHLRIGSKVLLEVKEVDKDEKVVHFILKKNLSWSKDKDMVRARTLN